MRRPTRPADTILLALAFVTVHAQDTLWRPARELARRAWRLGPLQRLHQRLARLPPGVALPLFLVPEAASRGGWVLSAWLLMQGATWDAFLVYAGTKLVATVAALWIYQACEPALLRVGWFARLHGVGRRLRQGAAARWRAIQPRHPRLAALRQRLRDQRAASRGIGALALALLLLASPAIAQADAPLLVQAEGQALSPFCAGRDVQVEGNHNVVTLVGACRSLLLKGVANQVALALAPAGTIRVEGSGNRVSYRAAGEPGVVALGEGNLVVAAPPDGTEAPGQAAAVAGAGLVLLGDDRTLAADCAGQDVAVRGARGFYLFRGGCRSVSVQGDLVTVQAEMASGATIAIAGHGSTVAWAVARQGRPPVATVRGEASRAQRIDAIGGLLER